MSESDPDGIGLRFRKRIITAILSVMALVAGSFVPTYLDIGVPLLAGIAGTGSVSCLGLVWAVNRGASTRLVGHVAVVITTDEFVRWFDGLEASLDARAFSSFVCFPGCGATTPGARYLDVTDDIGGIA